MPWRILRIRRRWTRDRPNPKREEKTGSGIVPLPYFFEKNEQQAKGERRVGLGVMGLADLLIYCEKVYGSEDGNHLVDQVFEKIAEIQSRGV